MPIPGKELPAENPSVPMEKIESIIIPLSFYKRVVRAYNIC